MKSPASLNPHRFALTALLAGLILRVGTLSLPGTDDVRTFEIWSYTLATTGITSIYGEGFPPRPHFLKYGARETRVNYPPLAMYELAVIGRASGLEVNGAFPNNTRFTIAIKVCVALTDAAMAVLLFFAVRPLVDLRAAWWSVAAYWVNPVIVLSTMLGYIDAFMAFPAVGALVAAARGWPSAAGVLAAAAMMTKPQAVFIAPAIALALWNVGGLGQARARLLAAIKSGAVVSVLLTAPFLAAGTIPNMLRGIASVFRDDMVSGTACNIWWIVSYLFEGIDILHQGLARALTIRVRILSISQVAAMGYPNPRLVGAVLVLGAGAWAMWTARRARDLARLAALAGFLVAAYFTLSAQVHENHCFLMIPLLVIAATIRREFVPILATLSVLFFLNLYLFYGFAGRPPEPIFRTITAVDSTVLLSVMTCGTLGWYAMILNRVMKQTQN